MVLNGRCANKKLPVLTHTGINKHLALAQPNLNRRLNMLKPRSV